MQPGTIEEGRPGDAGPWFDKLTVRPGWLLLPYRTRLSLLYQPKAAR